MLIYTPLKDPAIDNFARFLQDDNEGSKEIFESLFNCKYSEDIISYGSTVSIAMCKATTMCLQFMSNNNDNETIESVNNAFAIMIGDITILSDKCTSYYDTYVLSREYNTEAKMKKRMMAQINIVIGAMNIINIMMPIMNILINAGILVDGSTQFLRLAQDAMDAFEIMKGYPWMWHISNKE